MSKEIRDLIKDLGITPMQLKRILSAPKGYKPKIISGRMDDNGECSFGIVSDTHFGSIYAKINELHTFYEICRKRGIKEIVHAGDLVAGWGIYRGQENEVKVFGSRNQAQMVINDYPKVSGITTYYITGNHDLVWWDRSGVDIGEIVSAERPDMVYLGQYSGDVVLGGVTIRLLHGIGGGAYALSYKGQKIAEQIPSGKKPHILVLGHWHTCLYYFYRNIHIFNAGAFEGQTSLLLRMGINPTIGGWIVRMRVANNNRRTITEISPTFYPFHGE